MESANLHHQQHHQLQLQDQLVIGSSPLPNTPSFFGVGTTLSWTPNTILQNPSHFSSNIGNGGIVNSRDISRQRNDYFAPSLNNSSTIQDMGYQWATSCNNIGNGGLSYPYQKFSETMINHSSSPSSSSSTQDFHLQQQQQQPTISYMKNEEREFSEMMSEKLLLRNFSSGCQIKGLQFQAGTSSSRGSFSQILPTINISNLNQSSNSSISGSLDMNMQPLDLFTSSHRFSGCLSPAASNHNLGFYKDNLYYGLDDHVQQSPHRLPNSPSNKISTFSSGVSEPKRPSSFLEAKVAQSAQKKSRSDSRAPCPPIKVRKEKLGDRIAALQQLVAPFGKTDTASVLMEAIGYIKFLQSQVETLSVPYMKSSRTRTSTRMIRGGLAEDGNEESKRDLRSRGLCLVPLTCLSYVTEGGGGVWQPPNFG